MSETRSELPLLKIVPVGSVVPHEEHDMKRSEPLIGRLRSEGILKNPPVVAPFDKGERYVILDGTNRALALGALSYPHLVVQIVDYDDPALILDTWFHLVTGVACVELLGTLRVIGGLRMDVADRLHARAELARRQAIAALVVPESGRAELVQRGMLPADSGGEGRSDDVFVLYAEGDARQRADILKQLVGVYESRGHINRVSTDNLSHLEPYYDDVAALVIFPRYEPSEIMELAQQRAYLPPGLTRHVVPGRALRINFPLSVLADDRSLEAKNAWLQEWLRAKVADKAIRYYQESTYLFDE